MATERVRTQGGYYPDVVVMKATLRLSHSSPRWSQTSAASPSILSATMLLKKKGERSGWIVADYLLSNTPVGEGSDLKAAS